MRLSLVGPASDGRCVLPFHDVVRRIESCVDPSVPYIGATGSFSWELELKRLAVGIENHVEQQRFTLYFNSECQAVGAISPVRLVEFDTVPDGVRVSQKFSEAEPLALRLDVA